MIARNKLEVPRRRDLVTMSGETSTTGGDQDVEMRSEDSSGELFWTWIFPWGTTILSVGLLLLSFWLGTAGPVDEVLFGLTTVAAGVYAVANTLNEFGLISV